MAIQSGTATFTRFYVPEPEVADFWSFVDEKIRAGAHRDTQDGAEVTTGFVSWDDLFDASFAYGSYHKGEYVAFQYRMDQRKVPSLVLKQHVREAIEHYKKEHDGRFPPRNERLKIRDQVHARLIAQAFPQPSACDAVWNPGQRWLLVGTTSPKMLEAFLEHFERHFRLYPVPLYHAQWALNLLPLEGRHKDVLTGLISLKSPHAMHDGRFLGYEFLTWLWFRMETQGEEFRLPDGRPAEVSLGEKVILSRQDDGRERVICTTQAGALDEARTALRQGKLVEEVQVVLTIGDNEYTVTLDRDLWAFRSLKTPKQMPAFDEEDPDGRFLEKMFFLEEVFAAWNALYFQFLSLRLSPSWESDVLPPFQHWIRNPGEPIPSS